MTIIYRYSEDKGFYYISAPAEDRQKIINYIDLIGLHYFDAIGINIPKTDTAHMVMHRKYFLDGRWVSKIDKNVVQELKKAGIVKTKYKYKKDKK